jgi:acyl carrier protein
MGSNAVTERIKQIIVQRINPGLKIEELRDDTPLIGRGVGLDSVSLLELVVALESDFGVLFDEKDMTPELFANVASIADYVESRSNHH